MAHCPLRFSPGSYEEVANANGELGRLLAEYGKAQSNHDGTDSDEASTVVDNNANDADNNPVLDLPAERKQMKQRRGSEYVRRASFVPLDQQKKEALAAFKTRGRPKEVRTPATLMGRSCVCLLGKKN
jgi:hypothetical protein